MTATPETIERDAFLTKAPTAPPAATAIPPAAPPAPKHGTRMRNAALAAGITEGEMDALSPEQLFQEIRVAQVAREANRRPEPTPPAPAAPVVPVEEAIDWGKDPNTGVAYTENDYSPAIRKAVKAAYEQDKKDKQIEELRSRLQASEQREQQRTRREDGSTIEKVLGEFAHVFGTPEQRTPGSPQLAYVTLLGTMMHGIPDAERTSLEADLRKKIALLPGVKPAAPKPTPRPTIESPLATPEERTAMLTQTTRPSQPRSETGQFTAADLVESAVEAPTNREVPEEPQTGHGAAVKEVTGLLRKRGHYVPNPSPNGAEDLGVPE